MQYRHKTNALKLKFYFLILIFYLSSNFVGIADQSHLIKNLKPLHGFNLIFENHQLVGSYQSINGTCELNLFMSEVLDPDQNTAYVPPVRIFHKIGPGHRAHINTPEAFALEYLCEDKAESMSIKTEGGKKDKGLVARNTYKFE